MKHMPRVPDVGVSVLVDYFWTMLLKIFDAFSSGLRSLSMSFPNSVSSKSVLGSYRGVRFWTTS